MTTGEPESTGKKQGNRYRPGQSGNPAGRPRGSRNKTTRLCADLLGEDAGAIMATLVKRAKRGQAVALKLCVERLLPVASVRDRASDVELPPIERAADLAHAAAEVLARAAAGDLTMAEASEWMRLLDGQRRILETTDLVVRLEALESAERDGRPLRVDPDLSARVRRVILEGGERR